MKTLIIFGSTSDRKVYQKIQQEFELKHLDYDLRIASAHKTPGAVEELIKGDYDLFIAGAGLSAALPGVIAAKTIKPVIGIPCKGAFSGLDALLSVWQMPKGVSVIGAPIENITEAVKLAELYEKGLSSIKLVKRSDEKPALLADKAKSFLDENKIPYELVESDVPSYNDSLSVYIDFIDINETAIMTNHDAIVINVPYSRKDADARDALKLLEITKGLWSGFENTTNACLSAVQLINGKGGYDDFFKEYRKNLADKLLNTHP